MIEVLFFTQVFEPFLAPWGSWCRPDPYTYNGTPGYVLQLGWQEQLEQRNISFQIIEMPLDD